MKITRDMLADKMASYLHHGLPLASLVDWAENAMKNDEFSGDEDLAEMVARIGVADVRAFGMTWDDCQEIMRKLGYVVHMEIMQGPKESGMSDRTRVMIHKRPSQRRKTQVLRK